MTGPTPPDWLDRPGMQAWADGMAAATRRLVRILGEGDAELISSGVGEGEASRFPLEVNGRVVGILELCPPVEAHDQKAQVIKAIQTFRSLAEVRNSMSDLVRTTARQWRELSLLYRSSDLLRVDQGRDTLAANLLQQAARALRGELGLVRYEDEQRRPVDISSGSGSEALAEVAEWGATLDEGVMATEPAELERLGFSGRPPEGSILVVPLRCRGHAFGAMVQVVALNRRISAEDLKLASLLANQAGRAFDNLQLVDRARDVERLKRELELAAEIQASILPPGDVELDWLDFAGICVPAKEVGGDAFLFDGHRGHTVLAGVADVCGHGVSSALLANTFATSIAVLSAVHDHPGRLLALTNDVLEQRVGSTGLFVTAALVRIRTDGELTVASAGHPEILVASDLGAVTRVQCGDLPLGIFPGSTYQEAGLTIETGATVVVYSDGVTETRGADNEMYGVDRLVGLLEIEAGRGASCAEIRGAILEDVRSYREQPEQDDDVTVVVLRRTK